MGAPFIHPSAIIDPSAVVSDDVKIEAYSIVGAGVVLEPGVHVHSHVVIHGMTHVGARTEIFPFSTLGMAPQHLHYKGEPTRLIIGHDTQIREHVTIHRGTPMDKSLTQIGSHCLLMVGCHIAHDCVIGDHAVLANQTTLAGHVVLEDHVYTGGITAVLQFAHLGRGAMVAGFSGLAMDVIPYGFVSGRPCTLGGLNRKKLSHLGMAREEIRALYEAYHFLFHSEDNTLEWRINNIPAHLHAFASVQEILAFLRRPRVRTLCMPDPQVRGLSHEEMMAAVMAEPVPDQAP